MSKAKIIVAAVIEYEQIPERYQEEDRTPERMLAVDLRAAEDDPIQFIDLDSTQWSITGEVTE